MKIPMNVESEGVAKTIVAGYFKFGAKTLLEWGGTTGTIIKEIEDEQQTDKATE